MGCSDDRSLPNHSPDDNDSKYEGKDEELFPDLEELGSKKKLIN